jgi:hypothetical protein
MSPDERKKRWGQPIAASTGIWRGNKEITEEQRKPKMRELREQRASEGVSKTGQ